jgi:hypothetical protein
MGSSLISILFTLLSLDPVLPPSVFFGIMEVESGFLATARSAGSTASGLGQITRDTFNTIKQFYGLSGDFWPSNYEGKGKIPSVEKTVFDERYSIIYLYFTVKYCRDILLQSFKYLPVQRKVTISDIIGAYHLGPRGYMQNSFKDDAYINKVLEAARKYDGKVPSALLN